MRDKPFFAAGMRDERKFEGRMQDARLGMGGKWEVCHSHGRRRKIIDFSG